ncbi:MAG: helix-turn-helix domain-containing protein [Desulfobacteraceae bacterium]
MSLAHQLEAGKDARIWAASYDLKRDAFRVAMEDGRIFLLRRPIPEDDRSEILDVYIEGDGEVFTVIQATGNEFSAPWDVIENLASGKTGEPDPEVGKRIGQRVKALRRQRGLTQAQLAEMAGIKRPNISRLEAGTHVPGIPLIERLAAALQTDTVDLVG